MSPLTKPASAIPCFATSEDRLNHEGWHVAMLGGIHRDSETIDVANRDEILARLAVVDSDGAAWDTMRASHWACGWYEHLIVNPASEPVMTVLANARDQIDCYPILNEMRLSRLECERHDEQTCDAHCHLCEAEG